MGIEEEIESQLKIMEDKVEKEKWKKWIKEIIWYKEEYILCKEKIDKYGGERRKEFNKRLWNLIPYLDFNN